MNSSKKEAKAEAAPGKEKKAKLVRDSFTIPKDEYAAFDLLKARALAQGLAIKKSELLRAGLMTLSSLGDARFKAALTAVPTLKTGRPSAQESTAVEPARTEATPTVPTPEPAPAQPAKTAAARKSRKAGTSAPTPESTGDQPAHRA